MKLAILGANGHVGRVISDEFADTQPDLYARKNGYKSYDSLLSRDYDVIINCIGIGNAKNIAADPAFFFQTIEYYDSLLFQYLEDHKSTKVIHISSGAVFGTDMLQPIDADSKRIVAPNSFVIEEAYGMTKLYMEMKHRLVPYSIIDIRLYGLFSKHQPLTMPFFLSDLVNALNSKQILHVHPSDFMRDFIHPSDFRKFISCIINSDVKNGVFDTYTKNPASKFEILTVCKEKFGLQYEKLNVGQTSLFGVKSCYYSKDHKAEGLGYTPEFNVIDGVVDIISKNFI